MQIIIEKDKRFSNLSLWEAQREYYHQQGVDAWSGTVPFYITSNPYIANVYATLAVRFMQDWLKLHPSANKNTFYIMEIGAGSGQFSFYVLRRLNYLLDRLNLTDIKIVYVMTDFTTNNVKYWKQHERLKPYVENGQLDFAVYDVEAAQPIQLIQSKITLDERTIKNPMIVFANYIFDSVISDIFAAKGDDIKEARVKITTSDNNIKNKKPIQWDKVKFHYEEHVPDKNYYSDKVFNDVLFSYKDVFEDTAFLFPIGSLQCMQHLNKISHGKLLVVSSDKGYSSCLDMDNVDYPELDFHGSFSLMVNYDAIARYFKKIGGDAFMQTPRDGLVTAVFANGIHFDTTLELTRALEMFIEGMSPSDYFNLYDNLANHVKSTKLPTISSFLMLSHWDPFVYEDVADHINESISEAEEDVTHYLAKYLHKVAENFYYLPEAYDIYFNLGIFYQTIEHYEDAIHYYRLSQKVFGENYQVFYNLGLSSFYAGKNKPALNFFEKALGFRNADKDALRWQKKIKEILKSE